MAVDTCNEVTNYTARRVEVSQSEQAAREELVALQARADTLASELKRLRTREGFKFACPRFESPSSAAIEQVTWFH